MKTFKLDLLETEKQHLKKNGIKIGRLNEFAQDELCILLS